MRTGIRGLTVVVLAGLLAAPVARADEELRGRIERLEQELHELKEHERQKEAEQERQKTEAKPTAAKPTAGEKEPGYAALLERVKLGAYGSIRYEGSSLANQKHTFTFRRFVLTTDANIAPKLRGYMELEFERFRKFEVARKVAREEGGLTLENEIEATSNSEISFEQGWLQYDIKDWLKFRGGAVLVPLGRFNLQHDDNRWNLPRRSLVDRGVPVLPVEAAWDELGAGFLGELPVGKEGLLNYQAYVVNGASLDFEVEQLAKTRSPGPGENRIEAKIQPSTGTFGSDLKDAKAFTGRLAWSPKLGHELAGSWYYGQYTPDFIDRKDLWSLGLDGRTGVGPFELEGQYIFTRFEGTRDVARDFARVARDKERTTADPNVATAVEFNLANLARTKQGYWLEQRYRFWPALLNDTFLKGPFDNPELIAVLREEQVWLGDRVDEVLFAGGAPTPTPTENRRVDRFTAGLAYRPVPLVVFQLAYEFTQTDSGKSLAGVTNFLPAGEHEDHAHTVMVGAAFGF